MQGPGAGAFTTFRRITLPVILPAVLRVSLPYHPALYVPLALLHASLALRAAGLTVPGAWGNAAAIGLFIATAAALSLHRRRRA